MPFPMRLKPLLLVIASLLIGVAQAQTATQVMGTCLSENTTGKERKELARWIFVAMSSHPELRPLSQVTPEERRRLDEYLAALFTRLLTKDCLEQTRAAMRESGGGAQTFTQAGEILGRVAMQEMMADPAVPQSVQAYTKFLDLKVFEDAFKTR